MSRRRLVVVVTFLWLGALSGVFFKYRDDLGTVGRGLGTARSERVRLDREIRALDETQRAQAERLVELQTAVAANTEICGAHAPDLSDAVSTTDARLALSENRLAELAAYTVTLDRRTARNAVAHAQLQRRIFRD